ncbi:hypothetical protein [Paenibacillus albus]|uniref:Replicative DNA helicase n=1 Tax=Paenibacillus albus TaxID=2495582 RepID=A0A3Q8X4T0_9BACL|nr:hypothetical protein [Paenibacillus albus]AZN40407.1 hypothetical protein EJC50_12665 [Paenibacillus albus]
MLNDKYLHGFGARMENVGIFYPLFELRNVRKYDFPVDSIGMAILLFILEAMLHGSKGVTIDEFTHEFHGYINKTFQKNYTYAQMHEVMTDLIHSYMMNKGEPFAYTYWDFEQSVYAEKNFFLLMHTEIEVRERTSKLKLTQEAVEMLFKTKEMLGEIKVSISQLYLRQQIEKGVWDDASRTVKELRSLVIEEEESILKLAEKIQKDVLLVNQEQELKKQLERINDQIERERRDFKELQDLIRAIKNEHQDKMSLKEITDKEKNVFEKIASLQRDLYDVDSEHESLLSGKLQLLQLMNTNLDSLILHMFNTKLNFESEVLLPLFKQIPRLEMMNRILNPLLPFQVKKSFNPGKIFDHQVLRAKYEAEEQQEVFVIDESLIREAEEKERAMQEAQVAIYESFLYFLLKPLSEQEQVSLLEIVETCGTPEHIEEGHLFYEFLLDLHQMGIIELHRSVDLYGLILEPLPRALAKVVDQHDVIHQIGSFEVFADESQLVYFPNIRQMSNFILKRSH